MLDEGLSYFRKAGYELVLSKDLTRKAQKVTELQRLRNEREKAQIQPIVSITPESDAPRALRKRTRAKNQQADDGKKISVELRQNAEEDAARTKKAKKRQRVQEAIMLNAQE